jgi:hypothetical protein
VSYAILITTVRNPLPHLCTPRFATEAEAAVYGGWLLRRNAFITSAVTMLYAGPALSRFHEPSGHIHWLPAAEPIEGRRAEEDEPGEADEA